MDTNLLEQIVSEDFLLGTFKKRNKQYKTGNLKLTQVTPLKGQFFHHNHNEVIGHSR